MNKEKDSFGAVIILSIIFLTIIYKCFFGFKPELFFEPGDPLTHYNLAIKLYEKNIFQEDFPENFELRSWRTPGYPFFLYLLKYINILTPLVAFCFNIFFLTISFYVIFKIIKIFIYNNKYSILIFAYCFVTHIDALAKLSQKGMNECLYLFFLSIAAYLILKKKYFSFFGFFILGCSVLIRTTILPVMELLLLFIVIKSFYLKKNQIRIEYIIAFVPMLLWLIRNYYIFNKFGYFIGANSIHLLIGTYKTINWPLIDNMFIDQAKEYAKLSNQPYELIIAKLRFDYGLERIFANPFNYFFLRLETILRHLLSNFAIIPVALLFLSLVFNKIKKSIQIIKKNEKLFIFTLIAVIFVCLNSITFYVPRYGVIPSLYLSFLSLILLFKIKESQTNYTSDKKNFF